MNFCLGHYNETNIFFSLLVKKSRLLYKGLKTVKISLYCARIDAADDARRTGAEQEVRDLESETLKTCRRMTKQGRRKV